MSDVEEEVEVENLHEFVKENVEDFEKLYKYQIKIKKISDKLKSLKIDRKIVESKILKLVPDSTDVSQFTYKTIKVSYKKTINVTLTEQK